MQPFLAEIMAMGVVGEEREEGEDSATYQMTEWRARGRPRATPSVIKLGQAASRVSTKYLVSLQQ